MEDRKILGGKMSNSQRVFTLIFMSLVLIMLNADSNVMNPNLSRIEAEFGVDDADIGFMMAIFSIFGAFVSLFWGYFADKTSRKLLFVASVLLGEIPCLLTAFARDYTTFFILRVLTGIGVGAAFPLVFSMIGDIFGDRGRPIATAVLTTAFSLGQILGVALAGYTSNINFGIVSGWRFAFLIASAPNIPLAILFLILVPEPKRGASEEATAKLIEQGLLYPRTIKISDYIGLVKIKTNIYLFIQGIIGTIPWGAIAFLNKFLEEEKSLSPAQATTVYLVFAAGAVVGTMLGGTFGGMVSKKNPKYLPWFCAITTVIGCILALITFLVIPNNIPLLSLFGFIAGFFVAMTGPNMRAMLLDTNVPENRGAIFSIFNLTDNLGTGFGKWVAGILSIAIGLTGSLALCTAFWFGCAFVLFLSGAIYPKDIEKQKEKLSKIASEMQKG